MYWQHLCWCMSVVLQMHVRTVLDVRAALRCMCKVGMYRLCGFSEHCMLDISNMNGAWAA